jgi:peptidoglycan hydrolase CwlO-like protein
MNYIIALVTLLFVGCKNLKTDKTELNEHSELDSILTKSQKNLTIVSGANQKSDSLVTGKVEKTVQKIQNLETEVKQLKAENNELKDKLDDATNDDGKPFKLVPVSSN